MDLFFRLIPVFITFIVVVNVIQSLIKFFIGHGENYSKEETTSEGSGGQDNFFERNWRLQREERKSFSDEADSDNKDSTETTSSKKDDDKNGLSINKKGRMADFMDDDTVSIYESDRDIKAIKRPTSSTDFPDEIKIGENRLFDKDNLKDDIIKGMVMKEILDKPRSLKSYQSPLKR